MARPRILVTGATGFIGKSLIKALVASGDYQIYAVSRKKQTFEKAVNWILGDLRSFEFCRTLGEQSFQKIVHLGWEGLPNRTFENSCINLYNTVNLLTNLSNNKETDVVLIGSCLEYGDFNSLVSDFTTPRGYDHFAQSKILIHEFARLKELKYKWVRPFYLYGSGQSSKSLIPALLDSHNRNERIEIKRPESAHDFIHIEDFVSALILILSSETEMRVFNVGTGVLTSVGEIANKIGEIFAKPLLFPANSISGLLAKSESARLLGWNPNYVGIAGISRWLHQEVGS